MEDLEQLKELAQAMRKASLCGLGQTAPNPIMSTMKYFEDEYRAHIVDKTCPAGKCKDLLSYTIIEDKCIGCTACARVCPVNCISGEVKAIHTIDQDQCIKCGQCMRVCPTNVIHPAGLQAGIEGIWTPMLNFRMGTSGCQHNCIACGSLCPTAAIRPISIDERLGKGNFEPKGPIRIGMAFVERGRCLPWAMDRPCIVCQENCPVSPKAIFTRIEFRPVRLNGDLRLKSLKGNRLTFDGPALPSDRFATGDYFVSIGGNDGIPPVRIADIGPGGIALADNPFKASVAAGGDRIVLLVRLQQPYVDPSRCIGCGVCEHECPVKGRRAIRVTAENETRQRRHRLLL